MIARIRTHKPEAATHEVLWLCEKTTGLPIIRCYMFLWNWTDRRERFEWKPRVLKNGICPYDEIDFEVVLNVLANAGFVVKYVVDGRLYGWIPRFLTHQQINNREGDSLLPAPPVGAIAEYEDKRLRGDFHQLPPLEELTGDPPILGGSVSAKRPNAPQDSELGTRGPRVGHAAQEEQNGTEQNGTERNVRTLVEPTPSASTGGAGGRVVRAKDSPLPAIAGKATVTALTQRFATVLAEVNAGARRQLAKSQLRQLQAEFVFTYWANVHDHLKAVIAKNDKRIKKLLDRLDENDGDVSELLYAVDGAKRDRQLMGQNDRDTKYDGVETIFRDRAIVERCANRMPEYRQQKEHKMLTKWREVVTQHESEAQGS